MATHDEVYDILKPYATVLANPPENSTAWEIYTALLQDIPPEALQAAILDHVCKSEWFPSISHLRANAANIMSGVAELPPAAEAWGHVCRLMTAYGRNNKPEFDNPIEAQTVEALGWRNLCLSTNQVADRARFIECYNEYRKRSTNESVRLPDVRELALKLRAPGTSAGRLPAGDDYTEDVPADHPTADIGDILKQEQGRAFDRGERNE